MCVGGDTQTAFPKLKGRVVKPKASPRDLMMAREISASMRRHCWKKEENTHMVWGEVLKEPGLVRA